jgi:hypothetical protein
VVDGVIYALGDIVCKRLSVVLITRNTRFYGVASAGSSAIRSQPMIGDTTLIIESEMFGAVAR